MLGKKKKVLPKRFIVIGICAIVVIMLVIFSFTLKGDRKLNPIESFFRDTLIYVENIVTYPFRFVTQKVDEYRQLKSVREENEILSTSIDRVTSIETENIELRRQLEALKEELNIDYSLTDYEYLNASVISRNVGYWYNTITIDKGTYNGVDKDMVVINSKGLVGRVIRTTTFTSDVRLITTSDTNNKISINSRNRNGSNYRIKGSNTSRSIYISLKLLRIFYI